MARIPGRRRALLLSSTFCAIAGSPAVSQDTAGVTVLEPIVVTASGFAQQITDAPATITVIDAEEIEGRAYTNITDILQDTPGISIESGGKLNAPTITIRGMSESYVLLLVDGRPLGTTDEAFYNGFGGGQKTSLLPPPSAIERVEVIRGPMSSLYGSAASGGVVNVITKKVGDVWTGSLTAEAQRPTGGDQGTGRQGRFYVSGPLVKDRLGLAVFGSLYSRDADDIPNGFTDTLRRNVGGRLTWQLSQTQDLAFDVSRVEQDYENSLETTGVDNEVSSETTSYGLTHTLRWGAGNETRSFITDETIDIDNQTLGSSYSMTNFNTRTSMMLGAHRLTFGGDYRMEETNHDAARFTGSIATDLERWHGALFAEDEWQLTDDFALTLGGRFDRNEHYGNNFTPRVYGVWHMTETLTLKGGVSGGYKVPALKQADDNIVEPAGRGRGWDQGNSDLQPEESTNYELGMIWDALPGVQAGLTVYHTKFKDKIDRDYVCFSPEDAPACSYNGETRQWIQQYVNRDRAELQGVEATLDFPVGVVEVSTNYTYQDSEILSGEDEGQPFNDLPKHLFNVRLDWDATEDLGLWTSARYKSETRAADGEDPTPGYTLVDMGLTYQITDSVQGYGGVYNVFDREVDSATFGKVLDGRTILVGITTTF